MKRGTLLLIVFISTLLLTAEVSKSQGQSDAQLKNNPAASLISGDNDWLAAAGGNEVRVLLPEQHDCFYEIHYKSFVTCNANLVGQVDSPDRIIWVIYDGNSTGLLNYIVQPSQPGQPDTTVK